MGLLIVIIGGFIIYFVFIKKSESGTTLLTHRKQIHKFVQRNGGMISLYQGVVDYFVDDGFEIREVTKDYVYLHYGTDKGKVGVEILQVEVKKALITIGVETAHGIVDKNEIEVHSEDDSKQIIKRMLKTFNHGDIDNYVNLNKKDPREDSSPKNNQKSIQKGGLSDIWQDMHAVRKKYDVEISEEKGDELYSNGEYEIAAYVYLGVYNENLHIPEFIIKCINCYVRLGKLTEAKSFLMLAEAQHKTDYRVPFLKASINLKEGKLQEAFNNIKTARTMSEGDIEEVNQLYEMCRNEIENKY